MTDLANKIEKLTNTHFAKDTVDLDGIAMTPTKPLAGRGRKLEQGRFDKVIRDSEKIAGEEVHGLLTQVLKDRLFNGVRYVKGAQGRGLDGSMMEIVDS